MPLISVIIPVYNGEQFLAAALDSVFAQSFQDFEVVVINDGSTDGTERVLAAYADRIREVRQENRGLAASRGRGVALAQGTWVAFLDADDIWLPHKLARQAEAARQHPECGIISTDALSFAEDRVLVPSLHTWYRPSSGTVLESLLFGNWIPPSAAMVRRDCFAHVRTFELPPPGYGEDWLMWMQIAAHAPVHFVDEVLVRRRLHAGSMSSQGEDVQFGCLLRNFEIVRAQIPQLGGPRSLVDAAIFQVSLRRGLRDIRAGRLPQAREKLHRAVRHQPRSLRARLALATLDSVPAPVLRAGLRLGRWARRRAGAAPFPPQG